MRITIIAPGSRGDVQPYVALGLGLQQAGHTVSIAAHDNFETFVRGRGLAFSSLGGNPRDLLQSEQGREWLESGQSPVVFTQRMIRLVKPLIRRAMSDAWEACQGTEVIIDSIMGVFVGYHVAEKLGVPHVHAHLQPISPTRIFPSVWFPRFPAWLKVGAGLYNRLTHFVTLQSYWYLLRGAINQARREVLNLPLSGESFWRMFTQRQPLLYGFSPTVVPRPPDWSDVVHVTGYWFLDRRSGWQPPPDLVDFLGSGPPPVYVGFGSMTNRSPEETAEMILEALAAARQRGVLLTGWGGLHKSALPDTVFKFDSAPHEWLFPQMAAVVHHGGAGTTAAGLRAGIPSIIVPFFDDQPFWGRRVLELGVGPKPIPRRQLTAGRLADAIRAATADGTMRRRAAQLGETIRTEDGVRQAVRVLERYLEP